MAMFHGVLLLVSLLGIQIDQPADAELRAEVRRLVRQLDAPSLEQREAAEAALLRLGPAALDLLPSEDQQASAEIRKRLAGVRHELQRRASAASADASTISLRGEKMPLSKVLAQVEQQSGNAIVDLRRRFGQPAPERELTLDFERTPFWEALDRVLDQAGLAVYPFAEQRAVGLVMKFNEGRASRFGRASYSGPFRFEAAEIVARRNLLESNARSLSLSVEVAWEPRLRPIILVQRMADAAAVDGRGRPLAFADPQARLEAAAAGTASLVKLDLAFAPPPEDVRAIAALRGTLLATLPGRLETFRFRDLPAARNVRHRIAETEVALEQVRKSARQAATGGNAAETWEVRIRVRFDDAGDALESHRTWIFDNPAWLQTADGRTIAPDDYETTAQSENEVGVAFFFTIEKPIDRYAFVYQTPGSIITRGYDYELKDIPLP